MSVKKIGWQYLGGKSSFEEYQDEVLDETDYTDLPFNTMSEDQFEDIYGDVDFTPLGPFHKDDSMNVYRHFDFWICHTNFRLTPNDITRVQNADGVEVINPYWSPYRLLIAPGEMFDFTEVRTNVQEALCADKQFHYLDGYMQEIEEEDEITYDTVELQSIELGDFEKQLDGLFPYWILVHQSDDKCVYYGCKEDELSDFKDVLETIIDLNKDGTSIVKCSKGVTDNEYYNQVCGD